MAFRAQVGPDQIAIHQAQTVLITEPDGQINWPSQHGLHFRDTRMISAWAIYANGMSWAVAPPQGTHIPDQQRFRNRKGAIAARTLGLVIGRPYRWQTA